MEIPVKKFSYVWSRWLYAYLRARRVDRQGKVSENDLR